MTFPGTLGVIIKYLASFAVPLFYMIAGYYAYGCTVEKIRKRLIKILKILAFAVFWWLAFEVAVNLYYHTLKAWLTANFNWKTPIKLFVFCTIDWAIPLWYLIAMAETYYVWLFVVRYKKETEAAKFTCFLLFAGAALTVSAESIGLSWSYKINFLGRAMSWFLLGYLINDQYEKKLQKISTFYLFLTVFAGWIVTLSAVLFKPSVDYNYLGVLLTAPAIFMIGVRYPNIKIGRFAEYIAEKLSLFIYIFHSLVSQVLAISVKLLGFNRDGVYAYFHPVFTLIGSIAVAIVFEHLFRNKSLRRIIY